MFRRFTRTRLAIGGLAAAGALALAVGAYAYFSSTGTGTGNASVGTAGNNIYVTATTGGTVYPGGPAETLSFSATNFANFNQAISNIHATSVAACSAAWSTPDLSKYPVLAPTCSDTGTDASKDSTCTSYSTTNLSTGSTNNTADEFWIPDTSVSATGDGNLAGGATAVSLTEKGSVTMNDLNVNEDACQGKNLLFTFTTS